MYDDGYSSDFELYLKSHPTVIGASWSKDWGDSKSLPSTELFDTSKMLSTCDIKICAINRSLAEGLQRAEENLKRERLKVHLQKGKRIKHRRKQEKRESTIALLEERIRVLENRIAELTVRHANLGLTVVNLNSDVERLTRDIFERSIGFPPDMPEDETSLIIDALVWYCLYEDHDAAALANKYEMWNGNAEIKNGLYYILAQYKYHMGE